MNLPIILNMISLVLILYFVVHLSQIRRKDDERAKDITCLSAAGIPYTLLGDKVYVMKNDHDAAMAAIGGQHRSRLLN